MGSRSERRKVPFRLEQLEARDVPAGNITASLVQGTLTLTGDDYSNQVVLLKTAAGVQVTALDDTKINGLNSILFSGPFNAVKATLKGGNDILEIDNSSPFTITGNFGANLGDGDNALRLISNGEVSFGSLTYTGGDGTDSVQWKGAAGSKATGNVTLIYGDGATTTGLENVSIDGTAGLNISAKEGNDEIYLQSVNVRYNLKASMGAQKLDFNYNTGQFRSLALSASGNTSPFAEEGVTVDLTQVTSTLGGVTATSKTGLQFTSDSTDYKSLSLTGGANGYSKVDFLGTSRIRGAATIRGNINEINIMDGSNLTIDGAFSSYASSATTAYLSDSQLTAKSINLTGATYADFLQEDLNDPIDTALVVNGNFVLSGGAVSFTQRAGTANVLGALNLLGKRNALFVLEQEGILSRVGAASTVRATNGTTDFIVSDDTSFVFASNLTISGTEKTSVFLTPSLTSVLQGNLSVTGGTEDDNFSSTSTVQFDKKLSINFKGGSNDIYIGDADGITTIGGNLSIITGSGNDSITLDQVDVTGLTSVLGGAGADQFSLIGQSTLRKAFSLDLGLGDDTIAIATETARNGSVSFLGKVTATGGAGNDQLFLGLAESSGGTVFTKATFGNMSNSISGGSNINLYSALDSQYVGQLNLPYWI